MQFIEGRFVEKLQNQKNILLGNRCHSETSNLGTTFFVGKASPSHGRYYIENRIPNLQPFLRRPIYKTSAEGK
jgi:hypothetical protein